MDSSTFKQAAAPVATPSRLPAGSVLRLPNGLVIPHPNAEVSLPGAGDARAVGTAAIEETQAGVQQPLTNPQVLTESQAAGNLIGLHQRKPSPQPVPADRLGLDAIPNH